MPCIAQHRLCLTNIENLLFIYFACMYLYGRICNVELSFFSFPFSSLTFVPPDSYWNRPQDALYSDVTLIAQHQHPHSHQMLRSVHRKSQRRGEWTNKGRSTNIHANNVQIFSPGNTVRSRHSWLSSSLLQNVITVHSTELKGLMVVADIQHFFSISTCMDLRWKLTIKLYHSYILQTP